MPLPVIAGLPWLAGVIGGLFASVLGFFTKYLTKRLAIVAAAVTAIVGLTTAFFAAISTLLGGLTAAIPADVVMLLGHIMPANVTACISALLSAQVLRYAYEWNVKVVQLRLF